MITESHDGNNRYFHFPINVLHATSLSPSPAVKAAAFNKAIAYILIEVASGLEDDHRTDAMCEQFLRANPHLINKVKTRQDQCYIAAHKSLKIGCPVYDIKDSLATHREILARGFGLSRVSLHSDYFWQCRNHGDSLDWREFTLLCSVYAALGRDPCKCIKYDRLAAMALGFSTEKELQVHNDWRRAKQLEELKTFTTKQVRTTLDKLELRGFFLTASPDSRHKYYTVQLRPFSRLQAYLVKAERERSARRPMSQSLRTSAIRQMINEQASNDRRTTDGASSIEGKSANERKGK